MKNLFQDLTFQEQDSEKDRKYPRLIPSFHYEQKCQKKVAGTALFDRSL